MFFYIFIFTIGIVIFIQITLRFGGRKNEDKINQYWDKEHRSNQVRKKIIDPHLFYTPNVQKLGVGEFLRPSAPYPPGVVKEAEKVMATIKRPMISFPQPLTNVELKMAFGAANLEEIVSYEENFQSFVRHLLSLSQSLLDAGFLPEAETLAKEISIIYPNASGSYMVLADIYHKKNDKTHFSDLKTYIETETDEILEPIVRTKVLNYMNSLTQGGSS